MAKRRKTRKAAKPAKRRIPPVPKGYHTLTPYLTVDDAGRALDFYARAFGATEIMRMPAPGGKIGHAEMRIGNSVFMLSDEFPGRSTCRSPRSLGGTTFQMFLYVPDVDAAFKRALDAGCKVTTPLADMFWGDRYGKLADPFGNEWGLATHKEDVKPAEMARRAADAMKAMGQGA